MKKNITDAKDRNFIAAPHAGSGRRAFTIIEVLTVVVFLSIISMAAIQSFEYSLRKEKEERLRGTLNSVRSAIDRYYLDRLAAAPGTAHKKRFPASLEELVSAKYLRAVPADPVTGEATWEIILVSKDEKRVFDIKSKARGAGLDNSLYSNW
ncbi:MAG: hypothetical protein A2008_08690 [Candidatus Wallbacteria bacterium GWC2_49_35]|uniref:Type II secretion system protein GspG C-terminal domain-containing protein n=1 Tax=Candidatus Wallbacteria bacterium GWC2_49_35 TaxID=1817813 RepID=A0A1F7WLL6_9BACT|nr:MAG: hypothetical protein A2008_08690 [Candidatus Wallbacteria bacterium GWC2_49_35]HBC75628.1 hypothetical protein [Candidatus Wallbacteria bacterium]